MPSGTVPPSLPQQPGSLFCVLSPSLSLHFCSLKGHFKENSAWLSLGFKSISDSVTVMSHKCIPVSRGVTAPTRITRFEGVSLKRKKVSDKAINLLYSLEWGSYWEASGSGFHRGLVCTLGPKGEFRGRQGAMGPCSSEGWQLWPAAFFHLSLNGFNTTFL